MSGEGVGRRGGANLATVLAGAVMVIVWGSSSVATRVGMESYSPGRLALFRFLITTVIMAVYVAIARMRIPPLQDMPGLIGLGVVGISITQLAFAFGMKTVDPGTATFLMATIPVMTAVLSRVVLKERLTPVGWVGIGLTVVGTTVLVLGQGHGISYTRGALLLLFAAFSEAVYYILQKPWLKRYSAVEVSAWTLMGATLPLLIFLPGLGAEIRGATREATGAVVYVAVGAGAIGYACLTYVNSRMPATVAAVLLALMPPVAGIPLAAYVSVGLLLVGGIAVLP
ncbi:MAG: DMT family transporter, partial [Thermomicrobiales bacterium]